MDAELTSIDSHHTNLRLLISLVIYMKSYHSVISYRY